MCVCHRHAQAKLEATGNIESFAARINETKSAICIRLLKAYQPRRGGGGDDSGDSDGGGGDKAAAGGAGFAASGRISVNMLVELPLERQMLDIIMSAGGDSGC